MPLPAGWNLRWVPMEKVRDYLLADNSKGKEAFFKNAGFARSDWEVLHAALMAQAVTRAFMARSDRYGTTYGVIGPVSTPRGGSPVITTYWITRTDDARPQFTTAIPKPRPPPHQ